MTLFKVSPSQIDLYCDCPRKWFFKYVLYLPEKFKAPNIFGTILHEIALRYVREKPDLYPKDWTKAVNRFTGKPEGEVSNAEQLQIKYLVSEAIDNGVLRRPLQAAAERPAFYSTEKFTMRGFVDVWHAHGLEDHKVRKNNRYTYKKPKQLEQDRIMLQYGFLWHDQNPESKRIELRHNYFIRDVYEKKRTYHLDVTIDKGLVIDFWKTSVCPVVDDMIKLKSRVKDFRQVHPNTNICHRYGGCSYQDICTFSQTPEEYKEMGQKDISDLLSNLDPEPSAQPAPSTPVMPQQEPVSDAEVDGLLANLQKPGADTAPPPKPLAAPPAPAPEASNDPLAALDNLVADGAISGPPSATEEVKQAPTDPSPQTPEHKTIVTPPGQKPMMPWAIAGFEPDPDAPILGLTAKLELCPQTAERRKDAGGLGPKAYDWGINENGVWFKSKAEENATIYLIPLTPDQLAKKKKKKRTKKVAASKKQETTAWLLILGGDYIGEMETIRIEHLVEQGKAAVAKQSGKAWIELDPFKRRDSLVEGFRKTFADGGIDGLVICCPRLEVCGPDVREVVSFLISQAPARIICS